MEIRCDGRKECKEELDDYDCDIPFSYILYILASGFGLISLATASLQCYHIKNRSVDEIELANLIPANSVRPKPGFGIGNRNQDQVSVSVSGPELFLPKPKLSPI